MLRSIERSSNVQIVKALALVLVKTLTALSDSLVWNGGVASVRAAASGPQARRLRLDVSTSVGLPPSMHRAYDRSTVEHGVLAEGACDAGQKGGRDSSRWRTAAPP